MLAFFPAFNHCKLTSASASRVTLCDDASMSELPGQLAALSLPSQPAEALSAQDVVQCLCTGLKYIDVPEQDDGLRRLYHFTTYECRASLTRRKGYKSGVERFVRFAELHSLPNCLSFAFVGEPTIIVGTQTRGAMASICVDVTAPVTFRHKSGFERSEGVVMDTVTERYLFQLQQERRPPLAGCWMVTSLLPARDHMLFNGDTGAVQG